MTSGSVLTDEQRQMLAAAMERILPAGRGPGATDADAIGYVEWWTQQDRFQSYVPCLATGLALLESVAVTMWGKSFVACTALEQDAVLRQLQNVPHATVQRFFVMLVRMTLAGFLCAPSYGGNRAGVGWEYIGFTPRPPTAGATTNGRASS
ncbi:MAG: gluconate 2-dehydrogenase subunit 3 family protein [Gemmatimonadaceae bacterium]